MLGDDPAGDLTHFEDAGVTPVGDEGSGALAVRAQRPAARAAGDVLRRRAFDRIPAAFGVADLLLPRVSTADAEQPLGPSR